MTLTKLLDISAKLRNFCLFLLICTIFVSKLLENFCFPFLNSRENSLCFNLSTDMQEREILENYETARTTGAGTAIRDFHRK